MHVIRLELAGSYDATRSSNSTRSISISSYPIIPFLVSKAVSFAVHMLQGLGQDRGTSAMVLTPVVSAADLSDDI